jgi:endoglucanase
MKKWLFIFFLPILAFTNKEETQSWIRINQLGYTPGGVKVAIWCSKQQLALSSWQLVDAVSRKVVSSGSSGKAFGTYGPFKETYRLNFSSFKRPGRYYLQAGGATSP